MNNSGSKNTSTDVDKILDVDDATVDFSGFKAIDGMNFSMANEELRFLIGPNGAGKTTLLNLITGMVRPADGSVTFRESHDISNYDEHELAQLGIGRKMQAPTVFPTLTVRENLALPLGSDRSIRSLFSSLSSEEDAQLESVAEEIGLEDQLDREASELSHGQQQWLEIGLLLVREADLVLLDEPIAGMTGPERIRTGELIDEMSDDRSVLVVEHDMDFVRRFGRHVTVMHRGQVLAEGPVDEVQSNEKVRKVYLGAEDQAI